MNDIYLNVYNNLIKLTRNKNLYNNNNKQDTFYDRLIIFFFHLGFLIKVYKNIEQKDELQKFFDYCVRQIELSVREIGYGDATINKKMKDYVNILFSIIDKIDSWDLLSDQKKIINEVKVDSGLKLSSINEGQTFGDVFMSYQKDINVGSKFSVFDTNKSKLNIKLEKLYTIGTKSLFYKNLKIDPKSLIKF